jgi:hypothetical protein
MAAAALLPAQVRPAVELMMELSGGLAAPAQQQQQQE